MRTAASALHFQEHAMSSSRIHAIIFGRAAPCLSVRDIQAAFAFYSGIPGFRKVFGNGNPVGFRVLKKDGAEIHLSQSRDHAATTVNVFHMLVSDIDVFHAICEAAGVRIIRR
jgi:catechol 2,3-dioxygenase-like lactoylglutathione lyase family enzyme